jgi:uncharacterized protein YidB (DUF937 family)
LPGLSHVAYHDATFTEAKPMFDMIKQLFGFLFGLFTKKKPSTEPSPGASGGGLNADILGDLLGKAMGGGKDNKSILDSLVKRMAAKGLGQVVKSWIAKGPNMLISPDQVTDVMGDDKLAELSDKLGIPKQEVADYLAKHLPDAVDRMTPDGDPKGEFEVIDLTPKH